jgi:hypothetical protein
MDLPPALTQACRQGRLLLLWGALPFPLAARPPANRPLAINQWTAQAEALPPLELPLSELPPLPLLSLDASDRVERAFARAGVPLQIVRTRRDAPAHGRHTLLKLAGDLGTRGGLVLSHSGVRELHGDPDKQYLLDEARRLARSGALLLLGCDPAGEDLHAWWPALAPALRGAVFYALGEPPAAWPEGVIPLGADFQALNAALWGAQPEPEAVEPDIIEIRLQHLADNIHQDQGLLKDYEDALRYEDDPRRRARYRREIEQLHESVARYQREYSELEAQVAGEPSGKMRDIATQLQQMDTKLDALLN